jgi:hypothetical protein
MKIYVVTGTQGEYSDRSDWNVCAVRTEERAKELVSKLEKLCIYNEEFARRVDPEFTIPWVEANPEPYQFYHNTDRPKPTKEHAHYIAVCGYKNILPENKNMLRKLDAEHRKVLADWQQKYDAASKIQTEWYIKKTDAEAKWKDDNYLPPTELLEVVPYCARSARTDTYFNVDILEIVE